MPLPRDAKMTDVPSHTWILPTILKRAGVDFLHIGCNGGSGAVDLPPLFWWEGPDGSRLLTMYSTDYGTGLRPPAGWPAKTWLALMHTGDNHGPPTPSEVKDLVEQAARELPGVKVRMGRLSDFSDAVLKEKPKLPVVRADPTDGWIHGIMQMPVETKIARNVRPQIAALGTLGTLAKAWGVSVPSQRETLAAAYEGSMLYGEHTWGFDAKAFPRLYGKPWEEALAGGRYARLIESWGEHAAYIQGAAKLVTNAIAVDLAALARAVKVEGPRILVFNPLPWPRDGLVAVEIRPDVAAAFKDAATGRPVPCTLRGTTLGFIARDVPALGYRTYMFSRKGWSPGVSRSEDEKPPEGGTPTARQMTQSPAGWERLQPVGHEGTATLENAFFRLHLDPARGVVALLVDKRSGRELVDGTSDRGFGQYVYERYDANDTAAYCKAYCRFIADWVLQDFAKPGLPPAASVPHVTASPRDFRLVVERSAVGTVATMMAAATGQVPHDVTIRVTLPTDAPYVEFEWGVSHKTPDPWPESGWLCFPLKVQSPSFRLGRLGSVIDPAKDICHSANFECFCVNTGVNVIGADGTGVGLCPIDSPILSLGRPGLYRWTRTFEPRKPLVLVNLFHNLFGTNFQQWIGGTWSSRIRLWTTDGKKLQSDLVTPAREARSPLMAVAVDSPGGSLPPTQAGIELSRKGVLVTSLGPNPDGAGLLLRLWEQAGEDGPCRVRLPDALGVEPVQPCDLRGRAQGQPIAPRDGCFEIPLVHFAPATVIIKK